MIINQDSAHKIWKVIHKTVLHFKISWCDVVLFCHVISMINGKATLCSFKCMIRQKKEEIDTCVVFTKARTQSIIFTTVSQLGGWSDVFAYMSIRDAYLPDFKILPSVQFFARMWHVAILVTSGLCRAIYWPPSAASTIYLPLLLLSPSRAVSFFLFCPFLLFLCLFLSFFHLLHPVFCTVSFLSVSLSFFYLDHPLRSSWINIGTLPLPVPELRYLKLSVSIFCSIDSYRTTNSWPCE